MRSHVDLENESLDRTDLTADAPRLNPPETNFRLFLMDTNVSRPEDRNDPEAPVPVWRPPSGDLASKPGELVVTSHSSLWHRALPTQPEGTKRRLLILGYTLVWQKAVDKLSAGAGYGLTDRLMEGADEEMRELLGATGWY